MPEIQTAIRSLFSTYSKAPISRIDKLPQSGSDRQYFRIYFQQENEPQQSCIATASKNIKENKAFMSFAKHFKEQRIPVPEIYAVNEDLTLYLQQDFGDDSLLNVLQSRGYTPEVFSLYQKSLDALVKMQVQASTGLDEDLFVAAKSFGRQQVLNDLLYFKYYFLDTLKLDYDREGLLSDFEKLADKLGNTSYRHFMFRDFQARNIMVKDDEVYFIDFQGGMKGPLSYDLASLLWQAKADLPPEWKEQLLQYYIEALCNTGLQVNWEEFKKEYYGFTLLRLLQVLGAYGFRGLFEKKSHFLASIPAGLQNLGWYNINTRIDADVPVLKEVIQMITDESVIKRFRPIQADEETPLVVKISSFSFIQRGYPPDPSKNGGGFVFDCRGLLNPGRIEEYKALTGRDKGVREYLEQQTRMNEFLENVYNVVDIAVEDYIKRDFESLVVNFGCTGGRHRSVYAADALAKHLREKYNVRTTVQHLEQNFENDTCN